MASQNCQATTAKGAPCKRAAKAGGFCSQHSKKALVPEETITITFGDVAENHVGMEKIGDLQNKGFSQQDLELIWDGFDIRGFDCEIINLDPTGEYEPAFVLVVRNAMKDIVVEDKLYKELQKLNWDTKAKMYGRVVDKKARYNLCFADFDQEPDYEQGKGRVIAFEQVPLLNLVKTEVEKITQKSLVAEGNRYYDISKTGIGYHGDSERRIVIAIRLGASMPLYYQWYRQSEAVGEPIKIDLHHGDMYFMSEKAVGTDWKKKSIYTLRHATGCEKFVS